jgi:polyisoprenoid-binding protein YceI
MVLKKILLLFITLLLFSFNASDTTKTCTILITTESSLTIKGSSNINSFSCHYSIDKIKNPIPVNYHHNNGSITFSKTLLTLDNVYFDCGGKAINNDFNKILKSKEHPQILLSLQEINPINTTTIEATLAIAIAGTTKTHKIPVNFQQNENILVSGNLSISLSDYNLKAPKKLLGLITVDNTIDISFKLLIKED